MVDASDTAIGAVVQQYVTDTWQPLSFFSVRLNETQKKYSAYDRELLAAYSGIKHFKHLLEGREFTLFTDHKPLIYAFYQKPEKASPRQFRHLDFIGQFTTDIQHISGINNVVADTLSRIDLISIPESIDYAKIADAQLNDAEFREILRDDSLHKFKQIPLKFNSNKLIYCDTTTIIPRPFIPIEFRKKVFETFHNLSHPGIKASSKLLTKNVIWPSIKKDSRTMARNCLACQKSKISRHTITPLGSYKLTSQRFAEIHLDIIGPLPISDNQRYCVTLIDRYSRWAEAVPIPDITAGTVAFAVFSTWISRFGVPDVIVTDQGSQFESNLFFELSSLLGFKRIRTTSYNPKANGMIERWHRTLKAAIMCHDRSDWTSVLPIVLLGLRSSFTEELKTTPAEIVFGCTLRIPGQLLHTSSDIKIPQSEFVQNLKKHFEEIRPTQASKHTDIKIFVSKELTTCSHVFLRTDLLRKALQAPYTGPFQVINRNNKTFTILYNGKNMVVSTDRLKPCYSENNYQPYINDNKNNKNNSSNFSKSKLPHPIIPTKTKITFDLSPKFQQDPIITRAGRQVKVPKKLSD